MNIQMELGEMLAEDGMERALAAQYFWSREADAWLESLPQGTIFTAEDLVAAIGLPKGKSSNAVGAKIRAWAGSGTTRVGYGKTTRTISHSRTIAIWSKK